jgi:cobalamin synthase
MKFAFEIKTEPVTQAAIIVAVVAFSSGSLAAVAVYAQSPPVSTICSVVLAVIVYLALRFSPR